MKVAPQSYVTVNIDIDIASKFLEHFLFIADALSFDSKTGDRISLWHKDDGFYYDAINWGGPWKEALPIKSLVGLIPLFAVLVIEPETLEKFPGFKRRFEWFLEERKGLSKRIIGSTGSSTTSTQPSTQSVSANGSISPNGIDASGRIVYGAANALTTSTTKTPEQITEREIATENLRRQHPRHRRLFALVDEERLRKILTHMLNETQFLSEHGIRSYVPSLFFCLTIVCQRNILLLLKGDHLVTLSMAKNSELNIGLRTRKAGCLVATVIGEVQSGSVFSLVILTDMIAVNFLLIESLQRFWMYFRNDFLIECPTGSGNQMSLLGVAREIQHVFPSHRHGC
jgi:hypothetical protein